MKHAGRLRSVVDLLGLMIAMGFFFYYASPDIWNTEPATGGDTGSHFWPLKTLVEHALPQGNIKVWNPGNLGGEPHLVHYFPLPYLVMALISLFAPLGQAFNIGTFLPLFLFPACVFFCFRSLRASFPVPILATIGSLSYAYNESFTMWGGNSLSLLAGQFAHMYAVDFFLILIGCVALEMEHKKFPWRSILATTAVLLSHFYVALFVPFVFLAAIFSGEKKFWWERFQRLFKIGLWGLGLSLWFVIPMLDNAKWTTPYALIWYSKNIWKEIFPPLFYPFFVLLAVGAIVFLIRGWKKTLPEIEWRLNIPIWISLCAVSGVFYFLFPKIGLVDIRAFPTLQMAVIFLAVVYFGVLLRKFFSFFSVLYLLPFLIMAGVWWAHQQVNNFPHWVKWNYSSWSQKEGYSSLLGLSEKLKGDFSDPRVIYENSEKYNLAGTMRVFEMLPYFSGRSTLESVYMQATILAPEAFYLQAAISKTPSCPFPNFPCTPYSLEKHREHLKLMGASQLILSSDEVLEQARKASWLEHQGTFGMWHLYGVKDPVSYVEYLKKLPLFIDQKQFKETFYAWFKAYQPDTLWQVVRGIGNLTLPKMRESLLDEGQNCDAKVEVNFDQIDLKTNCPGKFHILKFAYHSSWRSQTNEELYLISPGFIGLIPKQSQVTLKFGQSFLWNLAALLSWIFGILFLAKMWSERKRKML